jgi:hypothetical protein
MFALSRLFRVSDCFTPMRSGIGSPEVYGASANQFPACVLPIQIQPALLWSFNHALIRLPTSRPILGQVRQSLR